MTKTILTYGHVGSDGRINIHNKNHFMGQVNQYFRNTSVVFEIRERVYPFSDNIRGYYFGVVVKEIQRGYLSTGVVKSLRDVDYEMRDKFLYYEEFDANNGEFRKEIHTLKKGDTKVDQKMMIDYVEMCIIWAVQNLQWSIPYPSEEFTSDDYTEHQKNVKNIGTENRSTF